MGTSRQRWRSGLCKRGWAKPPRERTGPPERETSPAAPAPRLPGPIQAKLKVGAVDDPLEHEADRVADQVIRGMPAPEGAFSSAPTQVSRKCAECDDDEKLQMKEAGPHAASAEVPAIVHEALRSPGNPLNAATRAYFEPRFGHDFAGVRVHTGTSAEQSARVAEEEAQVGKALPRTEARKPLPKTQKATWSETGNVR
jgi:hypothetical protein